MQIRDSIHKELNAGDLVTMKDYSNDLVIFLVLYVGMEGFLCMCVSHRIVGMMEKYFKYSDNCPYSFHITHSTETSEHNEILEKLKTSSF